MGTRTLVTEEEYLRTSFGDRTPEYVDGEIDERSLPNNPHSEAQGELVYRFRSLGERLPLFPRPEIRLLVGPRRYRIADLAVYAHEKPTGVLPSQVPLVVAEIVSPDDTLEDVMQRLAEYTAWGVPHVWLAEPRLLCIYVYRDGGLTPVSAYELPEFKVRISAEEILR